MAFKQMQWEARRYVILAIAALIGVLVGGIAAPKEGSTIPAYILGCMLLCVATGFVTLLFVDPRPKNDAPPATHDTTPSAAPAADNPELARQVRDIVTSGNEPALVVEELRRLTEVRP